VRNLVVEMFAPRFLADDARAARWIKYLAEQRVAHDTLVQLCFIQTARAQRVFRDFVVEVYWPRYATGATCIGREFAERFVQQALDAGRMRGRWSASTIRRISGYLMSCSFDFGLLGEAVGKSRPIRRFSVRPDAALYLAHDLHFRGLGDMTIVRHSDWQLFGLNQQDVVRLFQVLGQGGHLIVQASLELVAISWQFESMEECLNAIAQG
jgi:hypothetical protein